MQGIAELESFRARAVKGELRGRSGKAFDGNSVSTENNVWVLCELARELRCERSLEIGMALGASAIALASSYRARGEPGVRQHMAIDPFESKDWDDVGRLELERAGLADYVEVREDFSSLVLPQLVRDGARFGLIYIDGSHIFEDVFVDLYFATQLLPDGGVLLLDDCTLPAIRKVLRFVETNLAGIYSRVDLWKYRKEGGSLLKYRVGGMLGKLQLSAYRKVGPWPRAWNVKFSEF